MSAARFTLRRAEGDQYVVCEDGELLIFASYQRGQSWCGSCADGTRASRS
jgi:hypothetical protein